MLVCALCRETTLTQQNKGVVYLLLLISSLIPFITDTVIVIKLFPRTLLC